MDRINSERKMTMGPSIRIRKLQASGSLSEPGRRRTSRIKQIGESETDDDQYGQDHEYKSQDFHAGKNFETPEMYQQNPVP